MYMGLITPPANQDPKYVPNAVKRSTVSPSVTFYGFMFPETKHDAKRRGYYCSHPVMSKAPPPPRPKGLRIIGLQKKKAMVILLGI